MLHPASPEQSHLAQRSQNNRISVQHSLDWKPVRFDSQTGQSCTTSASDFTNTSVWIITQATVQRGSMVTCMWDKKLFVAFSFCVLEWTFIFYRSLLCNENRLLYLVSEEHCVKLNRGTIKWNWGDWPKAHPLPYFFILSVESMKPAGSSVESTRACLLSFAEESDCFSTALGQHV